MTDPETGAAMPAEAKTAATEFLRSFTRFKDDVSKRMTEMTTRIERLDRKSADLRRPALASRAAEETPHRKAFGGYIRQGDEDAFRALQGRGVGVHVGPLDRDTAADYRLADVGEVEELLERIAGWLEERR